MEKTKTTSFVKAIAHIPHKSGCYLYRDKKGNVLYVGKARDLSRRVRQYASAQSAKNTKTALLLTEIHSIDTLTTESEFDALLLEAKLIRLYLPKYNAILRDDKSPLYVVVTSSEPFPRILSIRKGLLSTFAPRDRIFGPFQSGRILRQLLSEIRSIVPFCTQKTRNGTPCFHSHLGLCAWCPSQARSYDSERYKVYKREYRANIKKIIQILSGKIGTLRREIFKRMQVEASLQNFEHAAYLKKQCDNLDGLLSYHYDPSVYLSQNETTEDIFAHEAQALQRVLSRYWPSIPTLTRIECIDISHWYGKHPVGSLVVLVNGRSIPSEYRRFRIKQVHGINDPAMIAEVVKRRLSHREWKVPQLLVIDGGVTQVTAAQRSLHECGVSTPCIGLTKRFEDILIYQKGHAKTIRFPLGSAQIRILVRIRDEAHRFALAYNRKLRRIDL